MENFISDYGNSIGILILLALNILQGYKIRKLKIDNNLK